MTRCLFAWNCLGLLLTVTTAAAAAPPAAPLRHPNYAALPVSLMAALTPLTDDQKTKIGAVQDKLKSDVAALHPPGQRETPDGRVQQKALSEKATADITAILTPDEIAALDADEPMLRLLGASRAIPERALPALNLTPDQITQIKTLAASVQTQQKALDDDRKLKEKAIQDDFKTKVDALLTPTQQAALIPQRGGGKRPKLKAP